MKRKAFSIGIILGLMAFSAPQLLANVIISSPTGGNNVSADKALNSTNGAAFTALGNIVLTEGAVTDFAAGNNQTLVLTIPAGWRFNPGVGTATFAGSANITAASVSVTASNVTVTFSVSGVNKIDTLTIGGLQVQALDGANLAAADYIRNLFTNPGTAVIAGINQDFTTFGLLNEVTGAAKALAMQTQPGATSTAGALFSPQPAVNVVDQFGNLRNLDNTTVVTAARAAGLGTLQGTLTRTAVYGVASYTNLSMNVAGTITIQFSASGLTSVTSDPIVVGPAPADHLVFATQPGSASAGVPFGIQPVLKTQDRFGSDSIVGLPASKLITVTLSAGSGTLSGTTTLDIGTAAGNGTVSFSGLQIDAAGTNKQLTASASGFTNAVSATFGVSAALFSKLQLLLPGEVAAPGTASGKTGTPNPQAAGTPFNVTVNAVDSTWNLVNTISDTVAITSSSGTATLPPNASLISGTKIFSVTLNTVGSATLTASDLTDGSKTPNTSPAITVGGGTPRKLTIQTQPSATATAGVAFAQQPLIRVEDAGGNLVATDNGRVITVARGAGTGTLQGTLTATTVAGIATFTNLSYSLAETITLNFTAATLTNTISGNVVVAAAPADRLVFTTQPGGASRAGSPLATQPVVKSRDQFGNPSSLGLPANLPLTLSLTSGSGALLGTTTLDIGTAAGNGIATYAGLGCTAAGTNKQLTATASGFTNVLSSPFNVGGLIVATGGSAISADTVGGTYTALTGPAYYEAVSGDVGSGTIILNPPAGFIFDTGGTAPTVLISRLTGSGNNINNVVSGTAAAITSRTTTQITFTVTAVSTGGACSLTWQNVRVRPSAGTPLASGNLTKTGTSVMATVTNSSTSFGTLTEITGTANRLAFITQPGAATAGAPFGIQPVVRARDQFGNDSITGLPSSKMVTITLSSGTGTLLGTTSIDLGTAAGNGIATFTDLEIDLAQNTKQLTASASGFTNAVSSSFSITPAAASKLLINTQPASTAIAGVVFSPQPVIWVADQFGNLRSGDSGMLVTASRNAGSGSLQGTLTVAAVNGVATFTNLSHTVATTLTIDFASADLTGAASAAVLVNPAAAARLTIQTQPSSTATAGALLVQQPVLRIEDQFGNLRGSDSSTVVTARRSAGSGTLQGTTNRTAVSGVVTFTDLSHNVVTNITILFTSGSLTSAYSDQIAVNPGLADRLVFTTQPGNATAGSVWATQPVLKTRDAFGNDSVVGLPASLNVTVNLTSGSGPLQGNTTLDIGTAAGNGSVSFADLRIDAAGTNKQLTASGSGLTSGLSSVFTINPAAGTKLVIQTQPSSTATAGAAFPTQPAIRVEDQFGNRVTTNNSTVVTATRNAGTAALQGSTSVTVSNGLATFSNLSYNKGETITMDFSGGSLDGVTSANVTVNAAAASTIVILTQPSGTATAGVPFFQQPAIAVQDAYGNLRSSDNSTIVTAARSAGSGTLQGSLSATAVNGVATFANLSHNVANTINLSFSSSGLTNATSANILISPGAFAQLQLLVPGETATPGSATGKTGSPSAQIVGTDLAVTVNAVDSFWNLVNTVSDTVGLSSSDATATLPPATNLLAGTTNLIVSFNTTGSFTLMASNLTDGSKGSSTSPAITVSPAQYTPTTGGTSISADTTGGTWTTLTGPSYSENASGNVGTGTIILNAPAGFIFDTSGTAPTVRVTSTGTAAKSINGASSGSSLAMSSVTATQLTFTVTLASSGGALCTLTWQNVRVRPVAGAPLASGTLSRGGTASVVGMPISAKLGLLREVVGAAAKLTIPAQPSASATAGVAFAQQPVLEVRDQFGNFRTNDNSTVVSATRGTGSGTLQGTTNRTAVAGVVTFTNLSHNVATTITITFSGATLSSTNSASIAISAASADRLVFVTQPGSATYGSALSLQPVLKTRDPFGNDSTAGLGASKLVTLSVSSGTGSLLGATSLDIGTATGNGMVGFSGLQISAAGTNKQLSASANGLTSALSSTFAVSQVTVTGSITANSKIYDGTTAANIATRALSGVVGSDNVSLSGGTATFASKTVGTAKTVTATGLSLSGLDASNYQLASTSATALADITARSLTVSATGVNKAYDGATSATVTLSDNRVSGDTLSTSYTSASFADKNVGTTKAVSVSGIALSGTDSANYSANTTASTTANISTRSLIVSASGVNKVYDATTDATVTLSDDRVAGDSLSTSYTSASFATKSAGTNKTVSVSGINLTGTDAANYTFNSTASTTANITTASLAALVSANQKVYDGTTNATIATRALNGVLGSDNASLSGGTASFATKTVGTNKIVSVTSLSLSGADAPNYQLASTTVSTTADITVRSLTVSAAGVNKAYDGTTSATVNLSDNRVAGDSLTSSYTSASFGDKNVGTNKPVSVSGVSISGADAPNYSANSTASTTANITAHSLTLTATGINKIYDGTTNATVTISDNRLAGDSLTTSYASAAFTTKTVGTNKTVSVTGLSLSGADAANYQLASSAASTTANITARSLSVTAAGVNKAYDGTTNATVTLSDNRVTGDSLTTSYSSARFADKNVGPAKTVTVSGISITGTDATNYSANTSTTTTADITPRSLSVTATGVNKVYDGTTVATVTLSDNRLAGDSLTTSYFSASFVSKSIGTNKTVSVSGIAVTGADAANYTANITATTTANITTRSLTVSATGVNKVYDGTTNATVTLSDNRAAGDSLSTSYTSAGFANKNVGTNKSISVSGISISGTDAGNYQLTSTNVSTTANISARSLTVSAAGVNKAYDGTTSATVTLSDNRVAGDSLSTSYTSASFADKNVGTAKPVSVSGIGVTGTDAANYTFNSSATATANITAKALTISATGVNKAYDGTTAATVTLSDNRVAGDSLSTSYSSATFATKSVGTNKTVSVSGISVTGTDAANYTFNSTASTTANIAARALNVTATGINKVYDGNTNATVTLSDNRVVGDSLSTTYASARFADKNVGTAKTVSVSGISISGTDAANYSANTVASTMADITARSLTVSATGVNKAYDGTTNATVTLSDNRVVGDSLTTSYTSASFADKSVGTNKTVSVSGISVSGTDALSYSANTSVSTTANITARSLSVTATGVNKTYDGTTNATVALSDNRVTGDSLTTSYASASFANKNVGTAKAVSVIGVAISGTDAVNYAANITATTTANITTRSLSVTATGSNKVYNGTTTATVTLSDNRLAGDSLTTSYTSASFANKNVGAAKTVSVSGISITGTDATNYSANTTASATADITAKALNVTATGSNKVYDGSTTATVTLADDRLAGDSLNTSYTSATFATKSVGTNKTVSVSGISVSGTDSANYTANTSVSTTANISAKGLTVTGLGATDKVYDATTTATLNTASATLSGVISGDIVSLSTTGATAAFADKNASTNKTVNVSALSLSGADAGNYTLTQPTTTASITKAGLTVTADNKSRAAGAANPTLTASYSGFVGGETLATSGVTGSPALSTTSTNFAGTYPITTAQGTLSAANYSFSFVNGVLTVTPASAGSLVILTQPSSTATAGVLFAQQPAIAIRDAYGNLRSSDNSTVVTAARNAGSGTLQGTLSATAVNGVATFANLSHNVANTINLTFSSSGLTNATSANILISPAAIAQLQLLVPGESAAPGTASGKTGTPNGQIVGNGFAVTVNAVDSFWNLVNAVADLAGITSSDASATLPTNAILVAGAGSFNVMLNTVGSATLSASDLSDASKTPSTSPAIAVGPAQYTAATGGGAISADTTGGTFTSLTGPSYSENASGNVGSGTIILKAPSGFVFDTGGTAPTVLVTRLTGSGSAANDINGVASGTAVAMTSVTSTQLVFTVTSSSASGVTCSLTWQNARVRPVAGAPLASGNLAKTGTATISGVSATSNLGALREVAGAANKLAVQTQPSPTATAGVVFAQQPIIGVQDKFGNLRSAANGNADNSTVVTASRSGGSGSLQGSLTARAAGGLATFTNLFHNVATNITISFSSGSLSNTTSSTIAISPAAAAQLVFIAQPGNGVVGSPLSAQPILRTRDQFGNDSAVGLGSSKSLTLTLTNGAGPLLCPPTMDIGTNAGNGLVSFTNLQVGSVGTNKQLTASASGLSNAVSSMFSVAKADQTTSFSPLSNKTYGDPSFTLSATASSGLPVTFSIVSGPATVSGSTLTMTGAGSVTVRASQSGDANWNAAPNANQSFTVAPKVLTGSIAANSKIYDGTTAATIATRILSGVVGSDNVSLTGGVATFASKNAGNSKTVTATGLSLTGTAAGNYQLASTSATTTADITAKGLTVSGLTANSKVYDGTTSATLNASSVTLMGVVGGDDVTLSTGSAAAVFANANVGTSKNVTVSGLTLSGVDAGNYTLTQPSLTANITPATITVTADNKTKTYGAANPTLTASYSGFVNSEDTNVLSGVPNLTTTADIDSPVGPYTISVTNDTLSAMNYDFTFIAGQLTITQAVVTVPAMLTGIQVVPNGIKLTFSASARRTYQIERASALQNSGTVWTNIGSVTTDAAGQGEFTDTNPPPAQGYYRTVSP